MRGSWRQRCSHDLIKGVEGPLQLISVDRLFHFGLVSVLCSSAILCGFDAISNTVIEFIYNPVLAQDERIVF